MLNGSVPCGCEARREIMFTQGNAGIADLLIVGVPALVVVTLIVRRFHK